jgi:hypothetical protein
MEYQIQNWFTIAIIVGVVISIIVSAVHRCAGAIVSLFVTTFVLCVGLDMYRSPGWQLTFMAIEISKNTFLIVIGVWYLFDIIELIVGCKKKKR